MQTETRQPSAAYPFQRQAKPTVREPAGSRYSGGLARNAVAAGELPFSALFYWVD